MRAETIMSWVPPWARGARDAALTLAARGWAVFPCDVGKHPLSEHGCHDATNDRNAVLTLWHDRPGPPIGVATGEISGTDALDLDFAKHIESGNWWRANRHRLPTTRTHRTRSGGLHLLFQHAEGVRNTASKIAPGVDTRGSGGYIIYWPATGLPIVDAAEPAPWPDWLLDEVLRKSQPRPNVVFRTSATIIVSDAQLRGLVRTLASTHEGERNSVLYWCACRVVEHGADNRAIAVLRAAARRSGLVDGEIERTINSALKRGAR